jgi:hypothetical protein
MPSTIERRIRIAAVIMLLALLLEFFGIIWRHPLAFAFVHLLAIILAAVAVALYLFALLPPNPNTSNQESRTTPHGSWGE